MSAAPIRPRILVIDDSPSILSMVAVCLEDRCIVVPALGGGRGLSLAAGNHFDMAIVDVEMPGVGGEEVVRTLRRESPSLPILMLSGVWDLPEIARESGVDAWLAKPFRIDGLRRAVEATLKAAAALEVFDPGAHGVRFFESSHEPSSSIAAFVAAGLRRAEGVIAIVTQEHRREVERLLEARRANQGEAVARGQLVWKQASELLQKAVPDGVQSSGRLQEFAGEVIGKVRRAGFGNIRLFGEGVDLLARRGRFDQAQQLEESWNGVILRERLHVY